MARLLFGTCSWTEPTLLASGWYPPQARTAEARLQFYAQHFPLVEVDSPYYAPPPQRTVMLWSERTPADFVFDVKAFSLFTQHPAQVRSLPKDLRQALPSALQGKATIYLRDVPPEIADEVWRRFGEALLPLDSAGKLGAVLFQFPPWFLPGPDSREHIRRCQERLPQYRLAVEFRNSAWLSESNLEHTLRFLEESRLSYMCVDEPQGFRSSVPPVAEATSDLAVVRFHGRNQETWEKKGISVAERFHYLYNKEELAEWVPRIQQLASRATEVHVLMNNCYGDYAVRNAQDLRDLVMQPSLVEE